LGHSGGSTASRGRLDPSEDDRESVEPSPGLAAAAPEKLLKSLEKLVRLFTEFLRASLRLAHTFAKAAEPLPSA
jgi:hypothetical protein